jgi:hypothetical protein
MLCRVSVGQILPRGKRLKNGKMTENVSFSGHALYSRTFYDYEPNTNSVKECGRKELTFLSDTFLFWDVGAMQWGRLATMDHCWPAWRAAMDTEWRIFGEVILGVISNHLRFGAYYDYSQLPKAFKRSLRTQSHAFWRWSKGGRGILSYAPSI